MSVFNVALWALLLETVTAMTQQSTDICFVYVVVKKLNLGENNFNPV